MDTKGDLLTYDSGAQNLAVGNDGETIIADSGEAVGIKWIGEVEGFAINLSDKDSDITTGEKAKFDMPFDFKATRIYVSAGVAPTGSAIEVDVEDEGTTILNAVVSVAAGTNNGETSSFTGAASFYDFSKGDAVSVDVDQKGSSVAGSEVYCFIIGVKKVQ